MNETYKVYAFNVGARLRDTSYFFLFTDPGKEILVSYYFWGFQSPDDFILVDTGFTSQSMRKANADIKDFQPPEALLSNIGIDPAEINKVILTHLHWDHCSGMETFKNAIFYVQKKELETFTGSLANHPTVKQFIDTEAVLSLMRLNYEGRLQVLEGPAQIAPGAEVIPMGGHTPGSQAVAVSTQVGKVFLTGDVIPFYRNLDDDIPTGLYWDLSQILSAHHRVREMLGTFAAIVPGHDPLVASRFESHKGVVTIA